MDDYFDSLLLVISLNTAYEDVAHLAASPEHASMNGSFSRELKLCSATLDTTGSFIDGLAALERCMNAVFLYLARSDEGCRLAKRLQSRAGVMFEDYEGDREGLHDDFATTRTSLLQALTNRPAQVTSIDGINGME